MKKVFVVFLSLVLLISYIVVPIHADSNTESVSGGFDLSSWQGDVNFNTVKEKGADFVILRVRAWQKDVSFDKYYEGAKASGLLIGGYVYMYATILEEAIAEAENTVKDLAGRELDLPLFLDIEDSCLKRVGKDALTEIALAELGIFEKAGYKAGVYSTRVFLDNYTHPEKFTPYHSWLAFWYIYSLNYDPTRYKVEDQNPFEKKRPICDIWQFTCSGDGYYYGVSSSDLDMNYCYTAYGQEVCYMANDPRSYEVPKVTLKKWDTGIDVAWLQAILYKLGYELVIDGSFGEATNKAVLDFQSKNNLVVDGYVGNGTRSKLIELFNMSIGKCINGAEHIPEILEEGKAPTCLDGGTTPITRCSVCGLDLETEHKELPALGHEFSNTIIIDIYPTDESDGCGHFECTRCHLALESIRLVNPDGEVKYALTLKDCAAMIKCLATFGVEEKSYFDYNRDGRFNAKDIAMFLRDYAAKSTQ